MIWQNWNQADKTLLLALAVFLLALCVHLQYPGRVVGEGFLFCAEAALVGGIADWFAVTALFRKPLGFPYHTAILPRRRDSFIRASEQMIKQEFFSRRKIFHHLEKLHLMPMLLGWLQQPETEAQVTRRLQHYARDLILRQDSLKQAAFLAQQVRQTLTQVQPVAFLAALGRWLHESGRDKELLAYSTQYLRPLAASEEVHQGIQQMLEDYGREQTQGGWAQFFAGLAEAAGAIDYEEAATLMQRQLLSLLDELGDEDSEQQRELLDLFYEKAGVLAAEPEFRQLLRELKDSLLADVPFEQVIGETLTRVRQHFAADQARAVDPVAERLPQLHSRLQKLLEQEYERTLTLVQTDERLRRMLEHFLYDVIARSALHAQSLIGPIVEHVLGRLTDEQLNHLVYDKVEPDLLWIRMNGSIVGALIGLLLFMVLHFAQLY